MRASRMTKNRQPEQKSEAHGKTHDPGKPGPRVEGAGRASVTYETVRQVGLRLPGVEEGVSYGTPALRVRGKLFVRLKEDDQTIVLRTDLAERHLLMAAAPEIYFLTDHYRDYPWVLVRLAAVDPDDLETILSDAWRRVAPKTLIKAREAGRQPSPKERGSR
jgi:hypothetical protein